jgi:hypothetical protein
MTKQIPLLAKALWTQSPEDYFAYVKGLIISKATASKEVSSVGIVFKKDRITVRVNRDPKQVTRDEVTSLAVEYAKDELWLLELLTKRKIGIHYETNDSRITTDEEHFQAQRDAKPRKASKRKAKSKDKLQLSFDNSRLLEESSIQSSTEPKE